MALLATVGATASAHEVSTSIVILSDDFERDDIAPWSSTYQPVQFVIENGVLVGQQLNPDHSAVFNRDLLMNNGQIELDVKFEGAKQINLNLNDMTQTKVTHAGHVARIMLQQDSIFLSDDLTGRFNLKLRELPKGERDRALEGTFLRAKLAQALAKGQWYHLTFALSGDLATVWIGGAKVAELRSVGFAHSRKDKIALNVVGSPGEYIHFDNLSVTALPD